MARAPHSRTVTSAVLYDVLDLHLPPQLDILVTQTPQNPEALGSQHCFRVLHTYRLVYETPAIRKTHIYIENAIPQAMAQPFNYLYSKLGAYLRPGGWPEGKPTTALQYSITMC